MKNLQLRGSLKVGVKSIKNKNVELGILLQRMFSFSYAGKAEVFIYKQYDKFVLVQQGVHLVEDIYTFSPNYIARFKFDSLYQAICGFNKTVQIITDSMDWYNADCFKGSALYDELFIKD